MSNAKLDENNLTPNQRLLLEYLTPGEWFDPDDNKNLRYINSKNSACRSMADKKILLKRPYSALGYSAWQFCLTVETAKLLKIERRELENES